MICINYFKTTNPLCVNTNYFLMKSNYNFPKQNSDKHGIVLHFVHLLIIWTNRR